MNEALIYFPEGWSCAKSRAWMSERWPKLYWSWYDGYHFGHRYLYYIPLDEIPA